MNKYLCYPVEYIGITGGFGGSHYGIDFGWESGHQNDSKALACADGVVKTVATGGGIGNYIIIQHEDRMTRYGHLSKALVKVGDTVKLGQVIGILGNTGSQSVGVHLHFDMVMGNGSYDLNKRIDPTSLLYAYTNQRISQSQTGKLNKVDYSFENAPHEEEPKPEPIDTDTYKVVKGDTLSSIANRFGISLKEIIELNPQIKNPNLIYPGQDIFVKKPEKRVYTVVKGDTLTKIANTYGTTVANLVELNKIENANLIYPGQVIKLN